MAKLNLEIKGVDKLLKDLGELGEDAAKLVDLETFAAAQNIELSAKTKAPKDMGSLGQSIFTAQPIDAKDRIVYSVVANASYAPYVEFGTGPRVRVPAPLQSLASRFKGRGGGFKKGLDNIREWCKRNGIEESAAYPIFMSILKKGLTPRPFMWPSFIEERPKYIERLRKLLKKLTNAI